MKVNEIVATETGERIRVRLVTFAEFAEFVRCRQYFERKLWERERLPAVCGGDEVLRRLGFRWSRRLTPVRGVSWYEAAAYCNGQGGRLPWYKELQALETARGDASGLSEWCGEWYHPTAHGPGVNPHSQPPTRRVAGLELEEMLPELVDHEVGFRVVFPKDRRPSHLLANVGLST